MHSYLIAASAVALTLGTVAISDRPAPPPVDVQSIISRVAVTYDINPAIIKAVAYQESRFDNGVCSKVGACGVMQLMPATAAEFGAVDRSNPVANIDVGTRHLVKMMKAFDGNLGLALAAYNGGRGRVNRWLKAGAKRNGLPQETREYVRAITGIDVQVWAGKVHSIGQLIAYVEPTDHIARFEEN